MQLMFQNGFSTIKSAPMGDYTIKKKPMLPLGSQSNLEKKDVLAKSQKDTNSLNEKRPLPPKIYDPFADLDLGLDSNNDRKLVKKIKKTTDTFLNTALPVDNKPSLNEAAPLKKLLQSSGTDVETEKKVPNNLAPGFQKPKEPEVLNKPKKPSYPTHVPNQTTPLWGNTVAEGNFLSNKLKYLPHVQSKESQYGNSVVPVLPSFLTENL